MIVVRGPTCRPAGKEAYLTRTWTSFAMQGIVQVISSVGLPQERHSDLEIVAFHRD